MGIIFMSLPTHFNAELIFANDLMVLTKSEYLFDGTSHERAQIEAKSISKAI